MAHITYEIPMLSARGIISYAEKQNEETYIFNLNNSATADSAVFSMWRRKTTARSNVPELISFIKYKAGYPEVIKGTLLSC